MIKFLSELCITAEYLYLHAHSKHASFFLTNYTNSNCLIESHENIADIEVKIVIPC